MGSEGAFRTDSGQHAARRRMPRACGSRSGGVEAGLDADEAGCHIRGHSHSLPALQLMMTHTTDERPFMGVLALQEDPCSTRNDS
jgi:hypothetical protein